MQETDRQKRIHQEEAKEGNTPSAHWNISVVSWPWSLITWGHTSGRFLLLALVCWPPQGRCLKAVVKCRLPTGKAVVRTERRLRTVWLSAHWQCLTLLYGLCVKVSRMYTFSDRTLSECNGGFIHPVSFLLNPKLVRVMYTITHGLVHSWPWLCAIPLCEHRTIISSFNYSKHDGFQLGVRRQGWTFLPFCSGDSIEQIDVPERPAGEWTPVSHSAPFSDFACCGILF